MRFPRVFKNVKMSSLFLFVLALLLILACTKLLLLSGPKREILLFLSAFDAVHCIFTGDSPFFSCCFYAFADSRRYDSLRYFPQSMHVATMLLSTKTPPVFCRASMLQP